MCIHVYDELLLPLLQRMFNLEKLDLNVRIRRRKELVAAKDLKENIIDYMARLNEFFIRIAESFPFVKHLSVSNDKPQKNKLPNDNEEFPVIEYPHLIYLILTSAHDDYIEQFLIDRKMCLPKNVSLFVNYQSLQRVTDNF